MCCKNRCPNTCRAGATAVVWPMSDFIDRPCATAFVCPMTAFIDRPLQGQEEARPEPNHARMLQYQGYINGVTTTVPQYCSGVD